MSVSGNIILIAIAALGIIVLVVGIAGYFCLRWLARQLEPDREFTGENGLDSEGRPS